MTQQHHDIPQGSTNSDEFETRIRGAEKKARGLSYRTDELFKTMKQKGQEALWVAKDLGDLLHWLKMEHKRQYGASWRWTPYFLELVDQWGAVRSRLEQAMQISKEWDKIVAEGWHEDKTYHQVRVSLPSITSQKTRDVIQKVFEYDDLYPDDDSLDPTDLEERIEMTEQDNTIESTRAQLETTRREVKRLKNDLLNSDDLIQRLLEQQHEYASEAAALRDEALQKDLRIQQLEQELAVAQVLAIASTSANIEQGQELRGKQFGIQNHVGGRQDGLI